MFGREKEDGTLEDNSVAVSVVPTSTDDAATSAPAMPQDELNLPAPAVTTTDDVVLPQETTTAIEPAYIETPVSHESVLHTDEPTPDAELSTTPNITINESGTMHDLSALKLEALHELSPLIGQLDQTPEEKYATANMVYEETNDQALLSAVYDAAKNLPDDKAKAEAIYDVVKKIDAFRNT
jgi:hypothetical protein